MLRTPFLAAATPALMLGMTLIAAAQNPPSLPKRGYDPNAAYQPGAAYQPDAKYDPSDGYDARDAYDAFDHFDPVDSFEAPALLVVLPRGKKELVPAKIEPAGWYVDLPERHSQRDQVLAELRAWSSSDEITVAIERMEQEIEAADSTSSPPIAHVEHVQRRVAALRLATSSLAAGDAREAARQLRIADANRTLAERARKNAATLAARQDTERRQLAARMTELRKISSRLDEVARLTATVSRSPAN